MDDLVFWTTMAQISATFTGLIFVGLVFYIDHIDKATKEVRLRFLVHEVSSKLLPNIVSTNLIMFVIPLAISLTLILEEEHHQFDMLFRLILVAIITSALIVTMRLLISTDIKKYPQNSASSLQVKRRIKTGLIILFLIILSIYGLIFANWVMTNNIWPVFCMKLVSGFSIAAALLFSLSDLFLFNSHHIFFEIPENFITKVETIEKQIVGTSNFIDNKVRECYKKLQKLEASDQEEIGEYINDQWPKIKFSNLPGLVERELTHMKNRFEKMRDNIPEEGHLDCADFLFSDKQVKLVTLGEITNLWDELDYLLKMVQDFHEDIIKYKEGLEGMFPDD
jgi:hypothetical protein